MNILFVCTGNTCRSVLAEYLLKKMAAGKNIQTFSAGIAANAGTAVPNAVINILKEEGVTGVRHTPASLEPKMADGADYIFVMESFHKNYVLERFPAAKNKTFLMKEFAARNRKGDETQQITLEVADPMGSSDEVYRRCFKEIKSALQKILEVLPNA
ncbi:MAG: low molecular weight protein arginine phosphatase [Elusimicrobia bacterium]|nr:low molecular weight protein arginine phosphatase [Elusimicrobiota bacterium]